MRFLALIAILFSGCSSMQKLKLPWNSRAAEQARMNEVTAPKKPRSEMTLDERIHTPDETLEFNPAAASFASKDKYRTGAAHTGNGFYFQDRVRTKQFGMARDFSTKDAWLSGVSYETKPARVKESWFSRLTARTKTYGTRDARDSGKAAPVRPVHDGERTYLGQGRIQPVLDSDGKQKLPMPMLQGMGNDIGPGYIGNVNEIKTIDDVKRLLNKGS